MHRLRAALLAGLLLGMFAVAPARAAINVERQGSENPVVEVARSTLYGGLAGLMVGSAIAWAQENDDGDAIRWGFVVGTFAGMAAGIVWVTHRPQPEALLEIRDGRLHANAIPTVEFERGARVHLVGLRF